MLRAAARTAPRALRPLRQPAVAAGSRRFLATAPANKKHTWRGTAVRWGLAVAAVYWYNTSPIFADEAPPQTGPSPPQFSESDMPTVDAVIEEKRKQADVKARQAAPASPPTSAQQNEPATAAVPIPEAAAVEELESEAGNEGAFNPETGEINWDCPCLGGMAHGPCGEEFKSAFSCFVYSKEEPKGMDCIDKFQHMQDCFRQYPEIYGAELAEDDEAEAAAPAVEAPAKTYEGGAEQETSVGSAPAVNAPAADASEAVQQKAEATPDFPVQAEVTPADADEASGSFPKKSYDATAANAGKTEK